MVGECEEEEGIMVDDIGSLLVEETSVEYKRDENSAGEDDEICGDVNNGFEHDGAVEVLEMFINASEDFLFCSVVVKATFKSVQESTSMVLVSGYGKSYMRF